MTALSRIGLQLCTRSPRLTALAPPLGRALLSAPRRANQQTRAFKLTPPSRFPPTLQQGTPDFDYRKRVPLVPDRQLDISVPYCDTVAKSEAALAKWSEIAFEGTEYTVFVGALDHEKRGGRQGYREELAVISLAMGDRMIIFNVLAMKRNKESLPPTLVALLEDASTAKRICGIGRLLNPLKDELELYKNLRPHNMLDVMELAHFLHPDTIPLPTKPIVGAEVFELTTAHLLGAKVTPDLATQVPYNAMRWTPQDSAWRFTVNSTWSGHLAADVILAQLEHQYGAWLAGMIRKRVTTNCV